MTEIRCVNTQTGDITLGDPFTRSVELDTQPGDSQHCTFTNERHGQIVIRKATTPGGGSGFGFYGTLGSFTLDDGQEETFLDVTPGTYSVSEVDPTSLGYWVSSISCSDGDPNGTSSSVDQPTHTATINVDAGETVECTFTNSDIVACPDVPGNLIKNYCFEDGTKPWKFWTDTNGKYVTSSTDPYQGTFAADVFVQTAGSNVQLYQKDITLEPNTPYELLFAAYSSDGSDLAAVVHQHGPTYTNYGLPPWQVDLQTGWNTYRTTFTTTGFSSTVSDARLRFWLAPYAQDGTTYRIDWVILRKVDSGNPPIPEKPPVVPPEGHCTPTPGNLIDNPGFEDGAIDWTFWTDGAGTFTTPNVDPYECDQNAKIAINQGGSNVQLYQKNIPLQPKTNYQLRIAARSNNGKNVRLFVHKHKAPYTNYGLNGVELDLTTDWQVFVVDFRTNASASSDARLRIWLAPYDQPGTEFEFDDVVLATPDNFAAAAALSSSLAPAESGTSVQAVQESAGPDDSPETRRGNPWKETKQTALLLEVGYFLDGNEAGRLAGGYVPDNGDPWCYSAYPSSGVLSKVNGKFDKVSIEGLGKHKRVIITAITSDEETGDFPDASGIGRSSARLRAENEADGDGRVYHIYFDAKYEDQTCSHEVVVSVPTEAGVPAADSGPDIDATKKSP